MEGPLASPIKGRNPRAKSTFLGGLRRLGRRNGGRRPALSFLKPFLNVVHINLLLALDVRDPAAHLEPAQFGTDVVISAEEGDDRGDPV